MCEREGDTDMLKPSSGMVRVQPAHGLVSRCLWLGFLGVPMLVPAVRRTYSNLRRPKSSVPGMSPPRHPPAPGSERHNRT